MVLSERKLIEKCKQKIHETFFPLKNGERLRQRDFEYLLEQIQDKSGIKVSLSTLKRIWREDYNKMPHTTTLNALVALIGYNDWREFQLAFSEKNLKEMQPAIPVNRRVKQYWPYLVAVGTFLVILIVSSGSMDLEKPKTSANEKVFISDQFEFSVNKTVTSGLPNSVIFHYNLADCKADSFFIQKSWNPANKIPINPANNYLSEIYYTPGFHWARLIANDSIIDWAAVHVLSDGWFAIAKYDRYDRIPVYLDQMDLFQNGALSISKDNFQQSKVDLDRNIHLRYYNVQTFEGVDAQNFVLETRARCEKVLNIACPKFDFMLLTESGVFYLELTTMGCVSELELKFGERQIYGRNNDLSALGTNVYEWQEIEWKTDQKKVEIKINGEIVYNTDFEFDFGKIVGVIGSFTGPGSMDYFRLKDLEGKTVYADEFEELSALKIQ